MAHPLALTPLPALRANDEADLPLMEREGFVDEEVVAALRNAPYTSRSVAYADDLALAADDMDFAGWRLSKATAARPPEVPPQVIAAIVRRAAPPLPAEPGLGTPHQGTHRWWLAGLAGVLSTLLFVVLLLSLSARPALPLRAILSPKTLTSSNAVPKAAATKTATELTDASVRRP